MIAVIVGVGLAALALERMKPGWKLPAVKGWGLRASLINLVQLGVLFACATIAQEWLRLPSVFHLSAHVSSLAGGLIAYLIATFIFYWWHRWRHDSDRLWLAFHQLHHSPRRLEVATALYKHPFEVLVDSLLGCALVYSLLGLDAAAGAVYVACLAMAQIFVHANVRTPRWIGFLIQRPEMHRIHHQKGRHRNNYGDLVWWDMLFGTYENPETWDDACGFETDRESRLGSMLACRDVHKHDA